MFDSYWCDFEGLVCWMDGCDGGLVGIECFGLFEYLVWCIWYGWLLCSNVCLLLVLWVFFVDVVCCGECSEDLSVLLDLLKLLWLLFKVLVESQVDVLLVVLDIDSLLGLCDCVMLELMYVVGLCVSELVLLLVMVVNLCQGVLWVIGKGSKEWLVLLGEEFQYWLECYLQQLCLQLVGKGKVYVLVDGQILLFIELMLYVLIWQVFWYLVKCYVQVVGIDLVWISLYGLWYSFVIYLFNRGVDLCVLQMLFGYSFLLIIQIYILVVCEYLQKLYVCYYLCG